VASTAGWYSTGNCTTTTNATTLCCWVSNTNTMTTATTTADLYTNGGWVYLAERQAPPLTNEQLLKRDLDLYAKAMEEHNVQEAERLRRGIAEWEGLVAEQRRMAEEAERQRVIRTQEREIAKNRAKELLLQHLSPQQQETYRKHDWFVVEGGRSKIKYRIRGGTLTANVDVLDKTEKTTHRLCAHPRLEACPMGDQLLAQKLTLEHAEDDFLRIANRHAA